MLTILIIIIGHLLSSVSTSTWSEWWTYEGISGPEYWGMVNPEWILCSKGRRQSPINIDLSLLLFDPRLDQPLKVDSNKVSVLMVNSGHELKLMVDEPGSNCVNISGGPLSYTYRVTEIIFHFGASDKEGSEHSIDNKTFPSEVQIVCYNSDLYGNLSHAQYSTNGLLMISLLAQISQTGNSELESVISHMSSITYKGDMVRIRHLSIYDMIPSDSNYITYEGSMTQPGCLETVTWIILNRPLYVTHNQLSRMRGLRQGGADNPKAPVSNNFRTTMPINRRPIRTNIDFTNPVGGCTMRKNNFQYQINQKPSI